MTHHTNGIRQGRHLLWIAGSLIAFSLVAFAAPVTYLSPWFVDEGPSVVAGDAPICNALFALQEDLAIGQLHVVTNQDSPFFGVTSQAEKQLQFERPFIVEQETRVALFAELIGTLRVGGGQGCVVVRAAALVLDANTYVPVAGLEISSATSPNHFDHVIQNTGVVEIADAGAKIATLPAGSYVVLGTIEVSSRMAKGWWNREAEANIALHLEFMSGTGS